MIPRIGKALIVVTAILVAGYLALRFVFIGSFFGPTMGDFVKLAQTQTPIVQAIVDYRADHGMLPVNLSDLAPTYLPTVPNDPLLTFDGDGLSLPAHAPHTGISYSFRPDNEGWQSGGDFGLGPLPLAKVKPTHAALTGDALIHARLAEYDHRPISKRNYAQKMDYLMSLGRQSEALETARTAANSFSEWWRAQMAMATLAPPVNAGAAETAFAAWVDQQPGFIHYWYLSRFYRDRNRHEAALAALKQAVKYPLAELDDDTRWVPNAFAFDAAAYAYAQKQYQLVLDIARVWSTPTGAYATSGSDPFAFKAAAELALGEFDAAIADADRVKKESQDHAICAGNLDSLQRAAKSKDRSYIYDPGNLFKMDWSLFSPPD